MNCTRPSSIDYPAIFHLLERAFAPSMAEETLVKDLLANGKIVLDLILEQNGRVLAYICFSTAFDHERNPIGYHLAPLAVLPGWQRKGLGQQIARESLNLLPKNQPVYVLGDPEYYRKFGFRTDRTQKCSFDSEGHHFLVLSNGPLPPRDVLYEDEFYELA